MTTAKKPQAHNQARINILKAQATTITHEGEQLFFVEGTLEELPIARTIVNLPAQIENKTA